MPADDLIPLFLSEASDRLDRLEEILGSGERAVEGSEGWRSARRELHTLKGASRMMGLTDIADVCHRAEDASDLVEKEGMEKLLDLVGKIRSMLGSIQESRSSETRDDHPTSPERDQIIASPSAARVPRHVLNQISDQSLQLSFLGRGVGVTVEDLYAIARTAESGVSDRHPEQVLATLAIRLRRLALRSDRERTRFNRLIESQLSSLLSIQVQPVRPLLSTLGRHAEELALSLGKAVKAHVRATRCRLDNRIMEALKDALLHLVANAVDHGIEPKSERIALGKSPTGTLGLHAETLAERVRLTVSDDGRGVDPREILFRATECGLVDAEASESMSDDAILQLLFRPDFSTREIASSVSGRGIGLDSVAEVVRQIGGEVWIEGEPGRGTSVTLDLPVTRRGESILVVEVAGYQVGIPSHQIDAFSGPGRAGRGGEAGTTSSKKGVQRVHLSSMFGKADEEASIVVHSTVAGISIDVVVRSVIGEEEVFLHPWPQFLGKVPGTDSLALTGAGAPINVLDLQYFLQPSSGGVLPILRPGPERAPVPKVLLVDDSRITREMFRRVLTDAEIMVLSVASGEEALAVLENGEVDCVVTDIEMPGIDGLDLTRRIRNSKLWEHLPVVLVSTRDQLADRMAGLEAGADAYLAKQNLVGEELVALVRRLGGRR